MHTPPLRSLLALSLSAALLPGGCTKPEEPAEGEAKAAGEGEVEAAEGEAKAAEGEVKPPTDATTPTPPPDTSALAAAVASMVEAKTDYPVELDPLLQLLPAGSRSFMVVRDMAGLLAVADAAVGPVDPALRSFAATAGPDAGADVARGLDGYTALTAGLRGPAFDLGKGVAVGDVDGEAVVIYGGAAGPDALPTLLRALGAEGDDMPDECKAIDGMAGYAVCANDAETLAKYVPGKDVATARATLGARLPAADIERANVLMHVGQDDDPKDQVTFAIATSPGLVHFTMGLADAPAELAKVLGSGPSPSLGLVAPGSGFWWFKADPAMIAEQAKAQPAIVRNVLGTLTGELMLGALADSGALVVLAGVSDPAPAGGLVALAGMQAGQLPKSLPDGTTLDIGVETLAIGGKDTQVLHAKATPSAERAKEMSALGLRPEAWLFAAGGYAGVVIGGGKDTVETVAGHGGGGMTPDAVRALPKPLAQGLVDGDVSLAMHVSLDGLQSPTLAASMREMAKEIPARDLPPGMSTEQVLKLAFSMVAPLRGLSVWMGPPKDHLVFHVAISLLGDPRTEEGQAAMQAMAAVHSGTDAATAYGTLVERFGGSDLRTSYEARAGTRSDGVLVSVATLGMLAAIAIPAVMKYKERAQAAALAMPPELPLPE